ncbi:MAG TPA: histone deacetylase [Planctomycetota bacterium]|nr:histone deacetylase [Planctomycetota bacterium]
MRAFSTDRYAVPLPDGHPFPMRKYRVLRELLVAEGTLREEDVADPGLVSREDAETAHDPEWVDAVFAARVDREMEKRIGLPVTPALSARARAAAAATLGAARAALRDGIASNLAGGTHHAGRARGAGFCLLNDLAIAALVLRRDGAVRRVAIVDLDVHQGDGTHEILAGRRDAFTFSMHGARNFPRVKVAGDLDVELPDGAGDEVFLDALDRDLPRVLDGFGPDLVLYQAGVDPLRGDRFGRLALSHGGLRERDRRVIASCRARGIPVATVLGGGYARDLERSIEAHANTIREAKRAHDDVTRDFDARRSPATDVRCGPT